MCTWRLCGQVEVKPRSFWGFFVLFCFWDFLHIRTDFFIWFFLLKDNCFTILYWFLPHINMNQSQVYIHPFPPEPHSQLPPPPRALGCHRALGGTPCVTQQMPTFCLSFIWQCLCSHTILSIRPTLGFTHHAHKSILCVCVSIATCK